MEILTKGSFVNDNYKTYSAYADEYMVDERLKDICNIDKNGKVISKRKEKKEC